MKKLPIVWSYVDEKDNVLKFNITFTEAKEVVQNMSSLMIRNLYKDFIFIGPVNDLSKILLVFCILEDGNRKIVWCKKASPSEERAYFNNLATGSLK